MSGPFESVQWHASEHRLDLGLYSHLKEFCGNGVRTHVNFRGKIHSTGKNFSPEEYQTDDAASSRTASPTHYQWAILVPHSWWWLGDFGQYFRELACSFLSPGIIWPFLAWNCLLGLVVKALASGVEDPGFESRLRLDFSGLSHTSDLKIGTPVATLPGAWQYWVSTGSGQPGVSILWLGKVESLICNFSVWQHINLSVQRYTSRASDYF